jgi:hypothetical protein
VDQANLHTESLTAVSILSNSFGIVVNSLPPSMTMGLIKFLFLRAEAAISMLQLSMSKMSWIGGSSFQPAVFNFVYTALCAARMVLPFPLSALPAAAALSNELADLGWRLKTCAYQLLRRSGQTTANNGESFRQPMPARRPLEEPEEETSWYSAFSLSRLIAYAEAEFESSVAGTQDESNRDMSDSGVSGSKSRSQSIVSAVSNPDFDSTAHSETAHLRAPILAGAKTAANLHPMLTFLLQEIVMTRGGEQREEATA